MQGIASQQTHMINGKKVHHYRLINKNHTSVLITNYGAIITSFSVRQPDGTANDIVLGFQTPDAYVSENYLRTYPYFGAAIGRYGNRIKNGRITIDNHEYLLSTNKGPDHLHGGVEGFDKKTWELISFDEGENTLILGLNSPDGEENYPGNLNTIIKFQLTGDDELCYEFTATTDKSTAVNLTHHSYFNLNNGKGDIRNHFVKINSSKILEQDSNLVVNGNYIPVENTKYDFRNFHRVNERITATEGYDQTFVLDKKENQLQLAAETYSEESKLKLQVFTDQPIVHFYTGEGLASMVGKDGNQYAAFSGFCLETQVHPNAINIPAFPNTILHPGETYRHKTVYRIIHV
jgi:aldose 1-epimerase